MPKSPSAESATVCAAILKRESIARNSMSYDANAGIVRLFSSPVIHVLRHVDDGGWVLGIDLCGWGDTATTRHQINSILLRLGLPYRVGQHRRRRYLYFIGEDGNLYPILEMPVTGRIVIPNDATPFLQQEEKA